MLHHRVSVVHMAMVTCLPTATRYFLLRTRLWLVLELRRCTLNYEPGGDFSWFVKFGVSP